ncbi:hypothetical protein U9M48_025423 [Paspalum notatum var. saurae]|uniref:Uncharacterized protein n=1 Tax=Paspalum notatum var. saurae TaxID=547442 RepID=A0AAQ3TQP9_PASNO
MPSSRLTPRRAEPASEERVLHRLMLEITVRTCVVVKLKLVPCVSLAPCFVLVLVLVLSRIVLVRPCVCEHESFRSEATRVALCGSGNVCATATEAPQAASAEAERRSHRVLGNSGQGGRRSGGVHAETGADQLAKVASARTITATKLNKASWTLTNYYLVKLSPADII